MRKMGLAHRLLAAGLVFLLAGCRPTLPDAQESPETEGPSSPTAVLTAVPTSQPDSTAVPAATTPDGMPSGMEVEVRGLVLTGGDQSPEGLMDAPRKFVYQVETEERGLINVTYTAFPPSPVGGSQEIELEFHAGEIQIGDFLVAYGRFDAESLTLYVEGTGHFIQTLPEAP
jgi:hypothetical protein